MNGSCFLSYQEWSDLELRVTRSLFSEAVSNQELFVRKLVNATVIHNQCFEHTSHESDHGGNHVIYMKPFEADELPIYGARLKEALFDYCDVSPALSMDCCYWEHDRFVRGTAIRMEHEPLKIAGLLLDHYLVQYEQTYENVYSVFDRDRRKVILFLKGVEL